MDSSDTRQKMKARYNLDNVLLNDNFEYLTQFLNPLLEKSEADQKSQDRFFEKYQDLKGFKASIDKESISPIRQRQHHQGKEPTKTLKNHDEPLDNLRRYGNFFAKLNPLEDVASSDRLSPLERGILFDSIKNHPLYANYCGNVGYEFDHIHSEKERQWLYAYVEKKSKVSILEKEAALKKLVDIHVFEHFLHTKFPGAKRFSIEGCEALAVFIEAIFDQILKTFEKSSLVLGMAHRGRLSILTHCFDLAEQEIFKLFLGKYDKGDTTYYSGDVKYHLGQKAVRESNGHTLDLALLPNPSHLEFINPVVLGYVRGLMDANVGRVDQNTVGILVHGDASVAGQGIVYESFQAMSLEGYKTEGTIHVVANNQIGFTADPQDGRSTYYCTDIAKAFDIPVIHVNTHDIHAVIKVSKLAYKYKETFKKDIMIDLIGYRKYGHNEGDEPVFTQPAMYSNISKLKPAYEVYLEALSKEVSSLDFKDLAQQRLKEVKANYESLLTEAKEYLPNAQKTIPYDSKLEDAIQYPSSQVFNLAIQNLKKSIQRGLSLNLNSKLKRLLENRLQMLDGKIDLDWGCGEWVTYAILLTYGRSVRISGQDSGRGTFSHRHAIWYDQTTSEPYQLFDKAFFESNFKIWDSYLSESGVLGFEYGYSLNHLSDLTIWEAQFGDFANGAQVIIDQFIASGRSKWGQDSNLVLMLPHGFEGQGPEHSSARIERFLQLCAQDNIKVANCTTPVSLYKTLISHVCMPKKRPLVIFTPKSLLRHKKAVSSLLEFQIDSNFEFQTILSSQEYEHQNVKKYILCSGKVYYDLAQAIEDNQLSDKITLVRLEQLYPVSPVQLDQLVQQIKPHTQIIWCQEEPQNAGPWAHFYMNIWPMLNAKIEGIKIECISRDPSASTATGFSSTHELELKEILLKAMEV